MNYRLVVVFLASSIARRGSFNPYVHTSLNCKSIAKHKSWIRESWFINRGFCVHSCGLCRMNRSFLITNWTAQFVFRIIQSADAFARPRLADRELRNCESWIGNWQLGIANRESRIVNHESWLENRETWNLNHESWIANRGSRIVDRIENRKSRTMNRQSRDAIDRSWIVNRGFRIMNSCVDILESRIVGSFELFANQISLVGSSFLFVGRGEPTN